MRKQLFFVVLLILLFWLPAYPLEIKPAEMQIKSTGAKIDSGGWNIWSNGYIGSWLKFQEAGEFSIKINAGGTKAAKQFPKMQLLIDIQPVSTWNLTDTKAKDYFAKVKISAGSHLMQIAFLNDYYKLAEDRNLYVYKVTITPTGDYIEPKIVKAPDWKKEANERIEKIRKGELTVKVVDESGTPVKEAKVEIIQKKHDFGFGTALTYRMLTGRYANTDAAKKYKEIVKEYFNCAVHENAMKWRQLERVQNKPDYTNADAMFDWCKENEIKMRGHCLLWASPRCVPAWLKKLPKDKQREATLKRIEHCVTHFKGKIEEFDVNNEMIANHYFKDVLGEDFRVEMFKATKKANPKSRLFLNDYGVLAGYHLDKYCKQIEWFLKKKAPVDCIGCQGHFGRMPSMMSIWFALQRLAKYKLPIKITEFDVNTKDEKYKAKALEDFYRICFSHQSVEGILMWGFWKRAHWKPDAAIFDKDFKPLPAAKAYKKLIFEEWWSKVEGKTNEAGVFKTRVFFGEYEIRTTHNNKTVTSKIIFPKSQKQKEFSIILTK